MKKKHIIGLSTLLLVLLLGLFTISYADDLGSTFVDQVITLSNSSNTVTNNGYISIIYSTFNNNRSYFSPAETYFSEYDYFIVESLNQYDSSAGLEYYTRNMVLYFFNVSGDVNFRIVNSSLSSTSFIDYRVIRFRNGSISSNTITSSNSLSLHLYQLVSNYDKEIKNDDGTVNSLINTAFNEGFLSSLGFTFIQASASTYADVGDFEDIPFYSISGDRDLYLGQLVMPSNINIDYRTFTNFYWKYNNWQTRSLGDVTYLEYVTTENDESYYDVYIMNKYCYDNTIYSLYWTDSDTDPFSLAGTNFYISNNYTSVTNGVLDVNNTFSGDYDEQYNGEQDNLQDVTNIEEGVGNIILDSSEVDNILSGFDTSGEIASVFGYHDFSTDTDFDFYIPHLFITGVIEDVIDELMREGDRYIDVSFHGEPATRIYARYFRTPEDNALIIFVRWCLIFGSIYCFYVYVVKISEELSTLNLRDAVENTDTDRFIYRM